MQESPPSQKLSILVVTECVAPERLMAIVRRRSGWKVAVDVAQTPEEALETVGSRSIDCLIVPPALEDGELAPFLDAARELGSGLPAIIFGDDETSAIDPRVVTAGVSDFVPTNGLDGGYEALAASVTRNVRGRETTSRIDRFHEALIENSADVLTILDRDGTIEFVSPAIESVMGYDSRDLLGEDAIEYVHPNDVEIVREKFFEDPRAWIGEQRKGTYRFRNADDEWRVVESLGYSLMDDPAVDGVVVNSRDVTERERRKEELELYETIVETVPVGLFIIDEEAEIDWVNGETVHIVGISESTLLEKGVPDLIEEGYLEYDLVEQYVEGLRDMLSSGTEADRLIEDVPFYPENGEEPRFFNVHWALRPFEDGEFSGTVVVFQEITERITYERQLERQNERLSRFASFVSHDLRNPLNVAQGYTTHALETGDADALEEIRFSLDRMEQLIEELLTLASEGHRIDEIVPVALAESAREAWRTVDTKAGTLEVEDDLTLHADGGLLRQLLENLFRNAVEHGGDDVTVRVGRLEGDDAGFFVEDDGVGILECDRKSIFGLGYTTNENGTGFGLAIVSETAEAHGWEIAVREGAAGGARFEFSSIDPDGSSC